MGFCHCGDPLAGSSNCLPIYRPLWIVPSRLHDVVVFHYHMRVALAIGYCGLLAASCCASASISTCSCCDIIVASNSGVCFTPCLRRRDGNASPSLSCSSRHCSLSILVVFSKDDTPDLDRRILASPSRSRDRGERPFEDFGTAARAARFRAEIEWTRLTRPWTFALRHSWGFAVRIWR